MNEINGEIRINCTSCQKNYIEFTHSDSNSIFCRPLDYSETCVVKYCKSCKKYNNFFCESCIYPNHEVNPISGSCIKKIPKVPVITWKDIFRLLLNQKKTLNGRDIYGPTLKLIGLTRNEIPSGHSLLVYLVFNMKYSRRNLEEEKKIPTICEIINNVEEASSDEINLVEYECIGNLTKYENDEYNLSSENLVNIEEDKDKNSQVIKNSNLNEVVKENNIQNLINKKTSIFTLSNLINIILFTFTEIKNQTSNNLTFNFTLNGKLNYQLNPQIINFKLPLVEINEKYADCSFEIKESKNADLNCYLNIEEFKNHKTLSFKSITIDTKDYHIYLDSIYDIFLINNYEKVDNINVDNKKKSNKLIIIICLIVVNIIIIGIIITFIILKKKKKKIKKIIYDTVDNTIENKENTKDETEDKNLDDVDIIPATIKVDKKIKKYYEK